MVRVWGLPIVGLRLQALGSLPGVELRAYALGFGVYLE